MIVSGRGQIVGGGVLLCILWGTSAFLWTTSSPAFLARTLNQPHTASTAPHSETIPSNGNNVIQNQHHHGVGFLSGVHSKSASPFMSALYAGRSSLPPLEGDEKDDEELEVEDDEDDDDSDYNMDDLDDEEDDYSTDGDDDDTDADVDFDDEDIDEDMESFLDDDEEDGDSLEETDYEEDDEDDDDGDEDGDSLEEDDYEEGDEDYDEEEEDDYEEGDEDDEDDEEVLEAMEALADGDLKEVLKELKDFKVSDDDDEDDDEDDDRDAPESDADVWETKGTKQARPLPKSAKTGKAAEKKDETRTIEVSSSTDMPAGKVQWKHLSTYDSSVLTAPPTTAGAGAGAGTEEYEGGVPSLVANAPALNTTRISSRGDIFGDVQAFWARIGISYRNMTHEKEAFLQERKAAYHDRLKRQREKYRRGLNDTGSPEYQVAGLTERINYLAAHLVENPKDFAAERGLVALVNKRRRHLNYLYKEDIVRYKSLIASLNIRHRPPGAQKFDRKLKYATFPPQNPRKLEKIKNKKKKKKQKGKR